MKPTEVPGIFKKNDKLFTENPKPCKGIKIYNEHLVTFKGKEYRSWNPHRSKLAAALVKGFPELKLRSDSQVLYLGAATGTTVSHISDIIQQGLIYAVENSPIAMKTLLDVSQQRVNIIPILDDANHPNRYSSLVPCVDVLYQDISQRNQADIFISNCLRYLKKNGQGILMVKARSVDVSMKPKKVYELIGDQLQQSGLTINELMDLSPYEKDHAAFITTC